MWQWWKNLILEFAITYFTCIARLCFLHCSWSCGRALAEISKKRKICTMARSILITLRKKDLWLFSGSIHERLLGNRVFRLADKYLQPGSFNWLNFKKSKIKIDNSVLYNLVLLETWILRQHSDSQLVCLFLLSPVWTWGWWWWWWWW